MQAPIYAVLDLCKPQFTQSSIYAGPDLCPQGIKSVGLTRVPVNV